MDTPTTSSPAGSVLTERWGEALRGGFVVIPSVLLRKQRELQLSDGALITLAHIVMAWWENDRLPYPGPALIARRMGVEPRTVQRHLSALVKLGYIKKVPTQNERNPDAKVIQYDLAGLVEKLKSIGAALPLRSSIIGTQIDSVNMQ